MSAGVIHVKMVVYALIELILTNVFVSATDRKFDAILTFASKRLIIPGWVCKYAALGFNSVQRRTF